MAPSIRRKITVAGLGLTAAAGVLAIGLAAPGVALADPTPNPSTSASAAAPTDADREAARAKRQDALASALATELGIDKAEVLAALTKVETDLAADAKADRIAELKTRLDTAVSEGKLTREEADAILKATEAGVLPAGGHRGPGR
jgi:hypothetical protein